MSKRHVIGIDLGTTNSCVAVMNGGSPEVIPNKGGYKTTPSMVAVTEAGKRLVGHIAKRQAITNAENTVYAAKRLIGRSWGAPQVKEAAANSAYTIIEGPEGGLRIKLREKTYSVPEISAMVLQEMKLIAEDHLGEPVEKAVITVPAYFNDHQRQATKDAGAIAGLDVIRIINEPTAAALAYGFGKDIEKTVAVYDLGGGTFDISILEIGGGGVFKVVATTGDTFLGGEDFDARIVDWLIEDFQKEHGVDLRRDRMALQRLRDAAEKAKCELSSLRETEINLPFIISRGQNQALHLQCTLSRVQLENLTRDLIDRTLKICREAVDAAEIGVDEIEEVVLVGGMTRMPAIQRVVTDYFGREPCRSVHPDEVVAIGAAVQGAALCEDSTKMLLLDVTPHALGIMTFGSHFEELIPKNTTVPTSRSKVFTTSRDNQTAVKILVLQGDHADGAHNEVLGEFVLTGLRKAPKGEVEVEVAFELNTDGIVEVEARDSETGRKQSIEVQASGGLSDNELSRARQSAEDYRMARRTEERFEAARQQAEGLLAELEKLFPDVQRLAGSSDFGETALEDARHAARQARRAIDIGDADELMAQIAKLSQARQTFKGAVLA